MRLKIQPGILSRLNPAVPLTEKAIPGKRPCHIPLPVHMTARQIFPALQKTGCHSLLPLCPLLRPGPQPDNIVIKRRYQKLHIRLTKISSQNQRSKPLYSLLHLIIHTIISLQTVTPAVPISLMILLYHLIRQDSIKNPSHPPYLRNSKKSLLFSSHLPPYKTR